MISGSKAQSNIFSEKMFCFFSKDDIISVADAS